MHAEHGEPHRTFFAPLAWVRGGWTRDVLLETDGQGRWLRVEPDAAAVDRLGSTRLDGPVLPGLVNAHSHAFQRAMTGLAERGEGGDDNFWSWRERMYRVALRISPEQLEAVAAFLYAELLHAGYTHVCEFHYLHNDVDGKPYADPVEMSRALARAAHRTGIGLTLLPTLYMRSGFAAKGLREDQRRFASTPESVIALAQAVRSGSSDGNCITAGVAVHSLRAVDKGAMRELADAARMNGMPVHIHIAEQVA
jgi:formimidoylglutamate deiminase